MQLKVLEISKKPLYGEPCNGCGVCCLSELCPPAVSVFGMIAGPCPALVNVGDRYVCGLVPFVGSGDGHEFGIGFGCDSIIGMEDKLEVARIAMDKNDPRAMMAFEALLMMAERGAL